MEELRAGAEKEGQGKTKNHLRYFGNVWNILEKDKVSAEIFWPADTNTNMIHHQHEDLSEMTGKT